MEERGLHRRRNVDGEVLVQVTEQGADLVDIARPIHAAAVREHLLDHIGDRDRTALVRLLEALAGD